MRRTRAVPAQDQAERRGGGAEPEQSCDEDAASTEALEPFGPIRAPAGGIATTLWIGPVAHWILHKTSRR
jgi:hypothetical protein